jgi:isocitrate dehydrogenase
MYWAQALANQNEDADLKAQFEPIAADLAAKEATIVAELNNAQGVAIDMDGYYYAPDSVLAPAMRPSNTLNSIIDAI